MIMRYKSMEDRVAYALKRLSYAKTKGFRYEGQWIFPLTGFEDSMKEVLENTGRIIRIGRMQAVKDSE